MLYFHPASGTHVRLASAATQEQRRAAPRVAMFGITNACNLACTFCSRDATRDSRWTVASAATMLRDLATAGTLEVAFGGGEPFAFRGFADLLAELFATTPLALHVTTNGTLLRDALWRSVRGLLGQVRMSIYPETRFREAADLFAASGQRWGANVLVDDEALAGLPALITELHERRCHDVSLLSYVGPDRERQLSAEGESRLASLIADSPLPCRLSVCFGDRIPAPRLFAGIDNTGDCGAGYDFVSITPDQRLQSCSFQDDSLPASSAAEVLSAWRHARARLAAPTPRHGCARRLPVATAPLPLPPVAVWQAFSGNNSGECILVARFETVANAEKFVAELLPGWAEDEPYSAAWRALFAEERVSAPSSDEDRPWGLSPREIGVVGTSVIALSYDSGDAFPELRALAWKRGAEVQPGGVHVHDGTVLTGIRGRDSDDARSLMAPPIGGLTRRYLHGDRVLAVTPFGAATGPKTVAEIQQLVTSLAGDRPVAAALFDATVTDAEVVAVKKRLGDDLPVRPRLFVSFWGQDAGTRAREFATSLGEKRVRVVANGVLIDPLVHRKRAAVLGYRRGATVLALDGRTVRVTGRFWFDMPRVRPTRGKAAVHQSPPAGWRAALESGVAAALPRGTPISVTGSEPGAVRHGAVVTLETDDPGPALAVLGAEAPRLGCNVTVWVHELDPLAWRIRRLLDR